MVKADYSTLDLECLDYDRLPPKGRRRTVSWLRTRPRALLRVTRRPPILLARIVRNMLFAIIVIFVVVPIWKPSYTTPPHRYLDLALRCKDLAKGCANPGKEKIFISVSLSSEDSYYRSGAAWGDRIVQLVRILGPSNVYLSIYEDAAGMSGAASLDYLRWRLGCPHKVVSDGHVSLATLPNITLPGGTQRTKQSAYLSELHNRALRPLDKLSDTDTNDGIIPFDKVLFLNSLAFRPLDAAHLLFNTNKNPGTSGGQPDYLAACALSHSTPFQIHDLRSLRDADGSAARQAIFPLFGRSSPSRADMLAQHDAVRVKACWGGMVAVQAAHVQNTHRALPEGESSRAVAGHHALDPERPADGVTGPVRFRHEPGAAIDASERCLFMADLAQVAAATGTGAGAGGIYVNPYVRVGLSDQTLAWLPLVRFWERLLVFVYDFRVMFGLGGGGEDDNPYRGVAVGQKFEEEVWDYGRRRWGVVERVGRPGLFCAVREMQFVQREEHRVYGI